MDKIMNIPCDRCSLIPICTYGKKITQNNGDCSISLRTLVQGTLGACSISLRTLVQDTLDEKPFFHAELTCEFYQEKRGHDNV